MRLVLLLRAHLDTALALLLTSAWVVEVALGEGQPAAGPVVAGLPAERTLGALVAGLFLLSLVARSRLPLLPLVAGGAALLLLGQGRLDSALVPVAGLVLACYSAGAWAQGRAGLLGALGVGLLAGLAILRAPGQPLAPGDVGGPLLLLGGAWLLGVIVRGLRLARGDPRVAPDLDGWLEADVLPEGPGRERTARELRDILERSMSVLVLQARAAQGQLGHDPARVGRALDIIEMTARDAFEETQRLIGDLLSPDGVSAAEPEPGLADLDYLAEQVTDAGLPVDVRVEGRPMLLDPEVDSVAYRVVHQALLNALDHAGPARASVVVRHEPDELSIEVVDDGQGLGEVAGEEEEEVAGLVAVRAAVAALGGRLDAGPGKGRGYRVLVRIPLVPAPEGIP